MPPRTNDRHLHRTGRHAETDALGGAEASRIESIARAHLRIGIITHVEFDAILAADARFRTRSEDPAGGVAVEDASGAMRSIVEGVVARAAEEGARRIAARPPPPPLSTLERWALRDARALRALLSVFARQPLSRGNGDAPPPARALARIAPYVAAWARSPQTLRDVATLAPYIEMLGEFIFIYSYISCESC